MHTLYTGDKKLRHFRVSEWLPSGNRNKFATSDVNFISPPLISMLTLNNLRDLFQYQTLSTRFDYSY
jgi:hypothetical protein